MSLRIALPIAAAIAGLTMSATSHAETRIGGDGINPSYGPVPVNSTGIVAAANYAATTKSVVIKKIMKARQAATADLHFAICMRVTGGNKTYLVETKVSRAPGKPYKLDAWTPVKACT
ncbi:MULTISPECIES: hypothetical protein [Asticcacaulis]|uniref:hypothetical protein n=1 Tax=Asticcacaulis TaxID=76890 RepID=UPI001AE78E8E|nr:MULTISPECIES: hypothetical protein [Asticcacaulis]MBP2161726.1 hypothetical protein [Asticcacaulis solisilvae]MDR6802762.1 hypothetical protein [Asticcacaulis sp. BE141]